MAKFVSQHSLSRCAAVGMAAWLAIGVVAQASAGDVYWVAPDGTEDAACTEADPGTIAAAIAKCVARESFAEGDVVMLKNGLYDFTGVECANTFYASLYPVNKAFVTIRSESDNPEECVFHGWGTVVTETELKDDDGNVTNTVTTTTDHRQRCFSVTGPALIRGIRFENFVVPTSDGRSGIFRTTVTDAGSLEIENCTFTGISINSLYFAGVMGVASAYRNCTFADNVETNSEVGFLCRNPEIPVRFERCSFLRNSSRSPNSLLRGSNISLIDCVLQENSGANICQDISLVQNCSFSDNQTRCIREESVAEARIDGCTFTGNYLSENGNGVCVSIKSGVNVLVTNSRFEENHTVAPVTDNRYCGGIAGYYGTYSNCVFKGNWGDNLRGGGGTVRYATLMNCTIESNDSRESWSTSIGLMNCTAINCLIKDNNQRNGNPVNSENVLLNCTVVGSVTTSAAVQDGAATNTIVYGTSGGVDIDTGDYNHVLYGTSSDAGTLTDCAQLAGDPFSGAATPETPYLPKRKSGAVETGIPLAEVGTVDYYGNKRLSGGALDIGCAEYQLLSGMIVILR